MRIAWRLAGPRLIGLAALSTLLAAFPGVARALPVPPPGGIDCPPLVVYVYGPGAVDDGSHLSGGIPGEICPSYVPGDIAELTATADFGATFVGWGGACQGDHGTCDVPIGSTTVVVTATFAPPTLRVSKTGTGTGTVTSSPGDWIDCGTRCVAMSDATVAVTLTATPDPGSHFTGWVGGSCDGSLAPCQTAIAGSTTVTARFDQDQPTVAPPVTTTPTMPALTPPPTCATDRLLCPPGVLRLVAATAPAAHGYATIELLCDGPGACDEQLVLTISVQRRVHGTAVSERVLAGRAHIVLAGGERQTVHVRLTRRVRALIAHRSRLRATLIGRGRARALTLVRGR